MGNYQSYPAGDHEFSNLVFNLLVQKVEYAFSDLGAGDALTIVIPAGRIVLGVAHEVVTAFSGGTPALNVGDGSDVDFWIAPADVTLGSAGDFYSSIGGANAASGGVKYNATGRIVVDHATGLTQGAGVVYVFYLDPNENWRLS